jgi:autotransporter-associated beta strand protein
MKKLLKPIHSLALIAAGVFTATLAPAQSVWNISSGNWSVAGNWLPSGTPGAATAVQFTNNTGAAAGVGTVDNTVDSLFAGKIGSLQYCNTNAGGGAGYYHTTLIPSGQTLTNAGNLWVGTSTGGGLDSGGVCQVNASIAGAGGTFLMNNTASSLFVNQASSTSGSHNAILTLTNLDYFTANIARIEVGFANGVNRASGILNLAKTNTITTSGSNPQILVGYNNGTGGNTTTLNLGLTNLIFANSITVGSDKQAASLLFNPVFTNNNPVAYFRGNSGVTSRVSSWILGNSTGQTATGSGCSGTVNFIGGTLDTLVDQMFLGESETGSGTGAGAGTGVFTFTAGTNNVNTLYLGYRIATGGSSAGSGTMNVFGTGTLVANNAICLSYWTPGANGFYASGVLNVSGGTVLANTITNGVINPGSAGSVTANVNVTNGVLGITGLLGSVGSTAWPLGILSLNGATLQLPVSGLQTNVAASIVDASDASNIVNITSIPAGVITYPTVFPLVSYSQLNGFNMILSNLPSSYQGFVSNDTANSLIDLVLTSGPTSISVLEWKGAVSANWDTATANWLSGSSSVAYVDGASALFDDTATGPTSVNLTANRSPAGVTVSNNVLPYAFSGAGIIGSGGLTKYGTGTLLFTNSGNTFVGNITINAGTVQFGNGGTSGALPSTGNVTDNGNLVFDHSSNDNVQNTIAGTGTLTKSGPNIMTLATSNSFSGTTMINAGTLVLNGVLSGSLTNAAGATIGGAGTNAGTVYVGGTIQPSAVSGTPTIFTSGGDLDLSAGATLKFNLNGSDNTEGGGINDLLEVGGNFNANNNVISLTFAGVPQTGVPYTIIDYPNGTQTGSLSSTVAGTHYSAAISQGTTPVTVTLSGSGANLKWNSTASAVWDVGTSSNWLNQGTSQPDVFYAGDNVLFDDSVAGEVTNITLAAGVAVYPALITVNSANNNYTIGAAGKISGQASIQKYGSSTLTLTSGINDFTNTTQVFGGVLKSGANGALGRGVTYVYPGATLDLNATAMGGSVGVSGAGVGGNGAIVNNGFSVSGDQQAFDTGTYIYVQSNSVFGCNNRWDIRNGNLQSGDGNPWNIAIKGSNGVFLVNATVDDALGSVDIQSGTFAIQTTTLNASQNWAGNANHMITAESGATLDLDLTGTTALGQTLTFNNNSFLQNEGTICSLSGPVTLSGTVTINNISAAAMSESGVISGSGGFTKVGNSALVLTTTNAYTGNTLVNVGTLQLGSAGTADGAIPGSASIIIAAGAVIDASQRSDLTLTLTNGQTLQGNGSVYGMLTVGPGATVSGGISSSATGILTVTNTVTLLGNALMKINVAGATNDVINDATNGATINLGGTLTVTNISATPFAVGNSFRLFNAAAYSGAFTGVLPATPGPGLVWNTNNLTSGVLAVASGVVPQPGITSVSLSGTNLVITGTNGLAGEQYNVVMTTNLTLPLSGWTVLPTNTFTAGPFSITNGLNPNAPQGFYRIRVP